jgi:tetratricopeptide (TPR) repeat protein
MMLLRLACAFVLAMTLPPVAAAISGNEQIALAGAGQYETLWRRLEEDAAKGPLRTRDLHALCFAYSKTKRYDKLLPCVERLQANIAAGDMRTRLFGLDDATPVVHLMRAEALLEMGQPQGASEQARRALEWHARTNSDDQDIEIEARAILALASAFEGRRADALAQAARLDAIDATGPLHGDFKSVKAMAQARVAMSLGQYQRAYDAIAQDRAFAVHVFLDRLVSGAFVTGSNNWAWQELPRAYMLNKALYGMGRVADAKAGFDQLLTVPQIRENGEINWLILYDRGRIAQDEGKLEEAIGFYRRAIEIVEQQRSTIQTEANKIGFVGDKQELYGRIIAVLIKNGNAAGAFEFSERSKSRALVDLLAGRRLAATGTGAGAQAALLRELEDGERELMAQAPVGANIGRSELRGRVAGIAERLRTAAPELASLVSVAPWPAADVQGALRADETMIEYHDNGDTLAAFVVDRKSVRVVLLDAAGLQGEIKGLRVAIDEVRTLPDHAAIQRQLKTDYQPRAQALYRRLLAPLLAQIKTPNLLLVAHGDLHYLPFAALHDGSGYVVERFGLRSLPSAGVLRFLRLPAAGAAESLLVFGNPDLGDRRFDLPSAEKEARRIAATVPNARLLLGRQASLAAFRRDAPQYRLIHFASHGEFDLRRPLHSGLLLSGPSLEQGRLTAEALYEQRLDADLVTMSACETGLGSVQGGDDVVGLTRGFLFAGAGSVIASLWEVDDDATAALMIRLYGQLGALGKREALHRAQLETMREYPHPFFWAGFYLIGGA